ncbi:MAG TPA: DUF5977 domain-containing protein [Cytophagaceae bacterium]
MIISSKIYFAASIVAQVGTINLTPSPITPNAASLGKYVEMPVGYYSGIPNINIPLFNLPTKEVNVPISLSYHASGIKVKDIPGWVGAGWSINAGGMITRITRGYPDFHYPINETDESMASIRSKMKDAKNLGFDVAFTSGEQLNILTTAPTVTSEIAIETEFLKIDTELDIYSFNFLGYTGRFTFDNAGNIILLPLCDLKIEFNDPYFKIIDTKGVEYFFEDFEISNDMSHPPQLPVIMSWCLSKIAVPHRMDTIYFKYKSYTNNELYDNLPETSSGSVRVRFMDGSQNTSVDLEVEGWKEHCYPGFHLGASSSSYPSPLGNAKFLDTVIFNNDTIRFYSVNSAQDLYQCTLDSITVKSGPDLISVIRFSYDYFNADASISDYKKKYLDSLLVNDQRYKFEYYESLYGKSVPHFYQTGEDIWGFYNGEDYSDIPLVYKAFYELDEYFPNQSTRGNTRKNSDYKYGQLGSLRTIVYPTGGRIEYEYEGNDYSRFAFAEGVDRIEDDPGMQFILDSLHHATAFANEAEYNPSSPEPVIDTTEFIVHYDQVASIQVTMGLNQEVTFSQYVDSVYSAYSLIYAQNRLLKYNEATKSFDEIADYDIFPVDIIGLPSNEYDYLNLRADGMCNDTYFLNLPEGRYRIISKVDGYKIESQINVLLRFTYKKDSLTYNAGGLRIKNIKLYNLSDNNYVEKNYKYRCDSISSGVLESPFANIMASQYWGLLHSFQDNPNSAGWITIENCLFFDFYDNPVIPLGNSQGGVIGYSKVTETNSDGGTSVFHFTNGYDNNYEKADVFSEHNFPSETLTRTTIIEDNSWKRGLIIQSDFYNASDVLVKQEFFQYNFFKDESLASVSLYIDSDLNGALANTNNHIILIGNPLPIDLVYKVFHPFASLKIKDSIVYYLLSEAVSETRTYEYDINQSINPIKTTDINSSGSIRVTHVKYPKAYVIGSSPSHSVALGIKNLISRNIVSVPIETYEERKGEGEDEWKTTYGQFVRYKTDAPFPDTVFALEGRGLVDYQSIEIGPDNLVVNSAYKPVLNFHQYSGYGNVVEQSKFNGIKEVILWGYRHRYPVVRVIGSNYSTVVALIDTNIINNPASDLQILNELDKIRAHFANNSEVQVFTYTYAPLIGMTAEVDPRGRKTTYTYDSQGRLSIIWNHEGNVVKKICYNYHGQPEDCTVYGNALKSQNFTRNNCTNDSTGTSVSFSVPANTFYASTQAAADAMAQAKMNAEGQAYANANGTCSLSVYNSVHVYGYFYSQVCNGGEEAMPYYVNVPAGSFTSNISQSDANNKAWLHAQGLADANGPCVEIVDVYLYNSSSSAGSSYYIILTNTVNSQQYYFYSAYGMNYVATVPAGTYNIEFTTSDWWLGPFYFSASCTAAEWGYTPTLYSVDISSSCDLIFIYE